MSAKKKRIIVLALGDLDKWGFNEETLPLLVSVMESSKPDYLRIVFSGVTGYFISSPRSVTRVQKVIKAVENLRDSDGRFARLGIGLDEGDMIADFHWWGGLKKEGIPPLGQVANEAVLCSDHPDRYQEKLNTLGAESRSSSL